MNLSSLNKSQIYLLLSLLEKSEAFQAELAQVESEISRLLGGKPAKAVPVPVGKSTRAGKPQKKLFKKGALKNKVLEVLKRAGKAGARIDEIAKAVGAKKSNLSVWFTRDSKKIEAIYKIRRSVYGLRGK